VKGSIQYYPWLGKFLILLGMFLVAEVIFSYLGMGLAYLLFPSADFLNMAGELDSGTLQLEPDSIQVRSLQFYQSISALGRFFIVPFLYCYLEGIHPMKALGLTRSPKNIQALLIVPIVFSAAVVSGFIYEWNSSLKLPERFSEFENRLQDLEAQAQVMTDAFLSTTTYTGLFINLIVVGVLAAVSEELIFRGLLQRIFLKWSGRKHLAVWLAAFAFSFIHLQFYGFLPRLILGAVLGYLYLYSGSLWAAIIGHFFNNAIAVVIYFLNARGVMDSDPTEAATLYQALYFLPVFIIFMWQYIRNGDNGKRLDAGI